MLGVTCHVGQHRSTKTDRAASGGGFADVTETEPGTTH
jgi:hypothetical protein